MSQSAKEPDEPENDSWFIGRPSEILMELPFAYQWEFTRRHPYYLMFWEPAHRDQVAPSSDPTLRAIEQSASIVLRAIGVTGDPPPPSETAATLDPDRLNRAWENNAVKAVTFRGLVTMLRAGLPPDLLRSLGTMLMACPDTDHNPPAAVYNFILELKQLKHPMLDSIPNGPILGINIHAPIRHVTDAVEDLVKKWKSEKGIPEQRRRDDKLKDYLAVWDLREGWSGDRYNSRSEQNFREIAKKLHISDSTALNRYRSAFRFIVGHDYTSALWWRVIGFLKISALLDPTGLPRRSSRRRSNNPVPRLVPEAVLQPSVDSEDSEPLLNVLAVSQSDIDYEAFVQALLDLIAKGWPNDKIIAELEMRCPEANELIDFMRKHQADSL